MRVVVSLFVLIISFTGISQDHVQVGDLFCTVDSVPYTGLYRTYHPDGTRSAVYTFVDGKLNRGVFFYDERGMLCMTGFYADNRPDGLWQSWSGKGTPMSTARYDQGKKVGEWTIKETEKGPTYKLMYADNELIEARLE